LALKELRLELAASQQALERWVRATQPKRGEEGAQVRFARTLERKQDYLQLLRAELGALSRWVQTGSP
jgi:hypothetical protein